VAGLDEEGIFRISAKTSNLQEARQRFNQGRRRLPVGRRRIASQY